LRTSIKDLSSTIQALGSRTKVKSKEVPELSRLQELKNILLKSDFNIEISTKRSIYEMEKEYVQLEK